MKKKILSVLVLVMTSATEVARADFTFGTPAPVPNVNSEYVEGGPRISADGLSLFFVSSRPEWEWRHHDLWVSTRAHRNDSWGEPVNLGPTVNSSVEDGGPSISGDGLSLYFHSRRSGGYGGCDIWVTKRATPEDEWGQPKNLGPNVNGTADDAATAIAPDELTLYFCSNRPGGLSKDDYWVARRATVDDDWGPAENVGPPICSQYGEWTSDITADGLTFFLSDWFPLRPAGYGWGDLWVSRRSTISDTWPEPVNLGATINTPSDEGGVSISADASTIYFHSNRPGGSGDYDIWQAPIEPVVDLNGDGMVDDVDICIMLESWGTDDPLCDIGPTPLGDGVVDVQDLLVLVRHMTTEFNDDPTTVRRIVYVDDDAAGVNDGSSWDNAFSYLQDALTDANTAEKPEEIWVAQGVYTPDRGNGHVPGDRNATFKLLDGVTLKGGFAGFGESDPNERDIDLYETILSGDLAGNDIEVENLEGLWREPTRAENSFHVVTSLKDNPTAVLDGFTITGGNANGGWEDYSGAGLANGVWFRDIGSSITVLNCTFTRNSTSGDGGGMLSTTDPTLVNCTFSANSATRGAGLANGGGSPTMINCMFIGNHASAHGHGEGGGVSNHSYAEAPSRSTLINCAFLGNWAHTEGGGMCNSGNMCAATLIGCTFTANSAGVSIWRGNPGGAIYNGEHVNTVTLTNCILWGDSPDEIGMDSRAVSPLVTYTDIEGGWPGEGNIDIDPLFADPHNGDYHLKSQVGRWDPISESWVVDDVTSPCVDGGDPMSPVGSEPLPNGGVVNMGAYGGTPEASMSIGELPPLPPPIP